MITENYSGYGTNFAGEHSTNGHHEEPGVTLERYAAAKQLPVDFLRSLNLKDDRYEGQPAIRIPYPGVSGVEEYHRYRVSLTAEPRFKAPPAYTGLQPLPYGLQVVEEAQKAGYVLLVEGESDAQVCWFNDVPAVGIPGVESWKKFGATWIDHLDGIPTLLVPVEADQGGERFWTLLSSSEKLRDRIHRLPITGPTAKDIGKLWELSVKEGREDQFRAALQGLIWVHSHSLIPFRFVNGIMSACRRYSIRR